MKERPPLSPGIRPASLPRRARVRKHQPVPEGGRSRRQEIFDHAVLLMHKKGFAGTSVQDLADRLDFSKANFYYHIKSKEDMLYRISFETLTLKFEKIKAILGANEPHGARMRMIIDCFVHVMIEHTAVISVYFEEKRHLSPPHYDKVTRLERQILDALAAFYREGIEAGDFKPFDPMVAVLGILGTCFWLAKWYRPKGPLSADEISLQLNQLVGEGYLRRTGADSARTSGL